jgi:hypothetical protein
VGQGVEAPRPVRGLLADDHPHRDPIHAPAGTDPHDPGQVLVVVEAAPQARTPGRPGALLCWLSGRPGEVQRALRQPLHRQGAVPLGGFDPDRPAAQLAGGEQGPRVWR